MYMHMHMHMHMQSSTASSITRLTSHKVRLHGLTANGSSRTGPSKLIDGRLPFTFPAFAKGRVIRWSSDSFHCSNSTGLHSMIKIVDLPHNTRD